MDLRACDQHHQEPLASYLFKTRELTDVTTTTNTTTLVSDEPIAIKKKKKSSPVWIHGHQGEVNCKGIFSYISKYIEGKYLIYIQKDTAC